MLSLAEAVTLRPAPPTTERILRVLFGGRPGYGGGFGVQRFGALGSIVVSARFERMFQQGPRVAIILEVEGLELVYAPRLDDPDDGPTVLTDLVGWILPNHLPVEQTYRAPSMPAGATAVSLGTYLAAELADLGVHADDREACTTALSLLDMLARHQGQAPGELLLAEPTAHHITEPAGAAIDQCTIWPALPVAGNVADLVGESDLLAPYAHNAGGFDRVLASCRLAIDADRWAFARVPRAIEREEGMWLT